MLWNSRRSREERLQRSSRRLREGSAVGPGTFSDEMLLETRWSVTLPSSSNNDQMRWSQGRLVTGLPCWFCISIPYGTNSLPSFQLEFKAIGLQTKKNSSFLWEHPFQRDSSHLHHERRPEVTSHPHPSQGCSWGVVGHSGTCAVCFLRIEWFWASLLLRVLIPAICNILNWSKRPWKWFLKVKAFSLMAR